MKRHFQVTFADGGKAVVAFGRQSRERIEIVLRAWTLLYQRELLSWELTAAPAEYWFDGQKSHICRYGDPICRDLLKMVIPLAVAIQHRKKAVEELRRQGRTMREIARQLRMPLPGVSKLLKE